MVSLANHWEYLGTFRPEFDHGPDERPRSGVLFSGWLQPALADQGITTAEWHVRLNGWLVELLCGAKDTFLLKACLSDGLECWVTGQLIFTWRTRIMVPDLFTVFSTRGVVSNVSVHLAKAIATTTLQRSLEDLWTFPKEPPTLCFGTGPDIMHPLAYASMTSYAERITDTDALCGLLFVAHAEAATRSCSSIYYGQDAVRLGSSRFTYQKDLNLVRCEVNPQSYPGEVVRGCLLVAPQPRLLLSIGRALTDLDDVVPWQAIGAQKTLIVAPREALAFVLDVFEGSTGLLAVACISDLTEPAFEAARIVIASLEFIAMGGVQVRMLLRHRWNRLISIGWPVISHELSLADVQISYVTHLALAISEDLSTHSSLIDSLAVGNLLGLSAAGLNEPSGLRVVLQQRVMHVKHPKSPENDLPQVPALLRYRSVQAPPLDTEEEAHLSSFQGSKRAKRVLFGALCAQQRTVFRALPVGMTPVECFRSLDVRLSTFALSTLLNENQSQECPVCFEEAPPVVTRCGHRYCEACLQQSMSFQARCPACRWPLVPSRDIIQTRPERQPPGAFLPWVLAQLQTRHSKTLLVASHGDLHERFAAWLRANGLHHVWAWRGNLRQLIRNLQNFSQASDGVLVVDPMAIELSWATFMGVKHVVVLWPLQLQSSTRGFCCQMREVYNTLEPGSSPVFEIWSREPNPKPPELPTCIASGARPQCPVILPFE